MNKWSRRAGTTLGMILTVLAVNAFPCQSADYTVQGKLETEAEYQAVQRADDFIWVYRTIDGKQYKRLWSNISEQWLTDWILCE